MTKHEIAEKINALIERATPLRTNDPHGDLPAIVDEINYWRARESDAPNVVANAVTEGADAGKESTLPADDDVSEESTTVKGPSLTAEEERQALIALAEKEGKPVDRRWGLDRLRSIFK